MYLNKVLLYGNLTRDPEVRALPSGQQVASFGLATNRSFKNKDGQQQEQTEYHNVVAFGRTAEVMGQYLKKGRPIYVEGRLQTRSWDKDGQKQYRTEIVVDSFQFGASQGGDGAARGNYASRDTGGAAAASTSRDDNENRDMGADIQYPDEEINPEDIPF